MPTYRVVFVNGEKRELEVEAHKVVGNRPEDKGDSYTFESGSRAVAVVPKSQVLYIEMVTESN